MRLSRIAVLALWLSLIGCGPEGLNPGQDAWCTAAGTSEAETYQVDGFAVVVLNPSELMLTEAAVTDPVGVAATETAPASAWARAYRSHNWSNFVRACLAVYQPPTFRVDPEPIGGIGA